MGLSGRVTEHQRLGGKILPSLARSGLLGMASFLFVVLPVCTPSAWARVVVLVESQASIYQQAARGFQQGFAKVDEVEQFYLQDGRLAEEQLETLRRSPPRLVVAIGTQAARYAKEHLASIPILYCLALHPIQNKLVGTNIGGIALGPLPSEGPISKNLSARAVTTAFLESLGSQEEQWTFTTTCWHAKRSSEITC